MIISLSRGVQWLVELIQNITQPPDRKPDDCDAAATQHLLNTPKCDVGIDVAHSTGAVGKWVSKGSQEQFKKEISIMLWTILVILLVLWLIGLLSNVGGGLIHLLLVVAVVVLIINLVTGRRAV